jgi:hypothetical protein
MKKRAVLCIDCNSSSPVPSEAKPMVVCRDVGAYTYNWMVCEYKTPPLSHQTRNSKRKSAETVARKAKKLTSDPDQDGYMTSHSVDYGFCSL